jgi:uncharacterized protein
MSTILALLTAQALLGAFDHLWNHEINERLPSKRSAAGEVALHSARDLIYALIYLQLGWFEPHGIWAAVLAATLGIEILITLTDFVVEDRTRRLPPGERILHTVLAINFGMFLITFAATIKEWWQLPSGFDAVTHGTYTDLFTFFALGACAFGIRNALAALRLRRPPEWVRDPIEAGSNHNARTVLLSGGTGFIGGHLVRRLIARGERVILLTRDTDKALDRFGPHIRTITTLTELSADERVDAIINLAGAPILGLPWTQVRRRQLINSRVNTTRALVALCGRLTRPPRIFVTGSAVGYYGLGGDQPIDEQGEPQPIFQSKLCQEWEAAAQAAEGVGIRVVRLRMGIVLANSGGSLPQLIKPVRLGLGAILGTGKQWVSWIHIDDLVRLFEFALDTPTCKGAVNAVSPAAATHEQMQRVLGKVLRRRLWLRAPAALIRALLGEMSQLLVDGQRVTPMRALRSGFTFRYPNLGAALEQLLGRPKALTETAQIYYNGDCPVCRTEMRHYADICATARPELRFFDSTQFPEEFSRCGLRREHLERRVYVRDSEGLILSGMPAIIALWRKMPRYEWLAKMVSLPLIRPTAVVLYDHVIAPTLFRWARSHSRSRIQLPS